MKKKALVIDDENRTRDLIAKLINSFELDIEAISEGEFMLNRLIIFIIYWGASSTSSKVKEVIAH